MTEAPETVQRGLWGVTTLVCAAVFLWLAAPAKTHGVFPWERVLAAAIAGWHGPRLDIAMRVLSSLTQAVVVVPTVVAAVFLRRRRWGSFAWPAAIVEGVL